MSGSLNKLAPEIIKADIFNNIESFTKNIKLIFKNMDFILIKFIIFYNFYL